MLSLLHYMKEQQFIVTQISQIIDVNHFTKTTGMIWNMFTIIKHIKICFIHQVWEFINNEIFNLKKPVSIYCYNLFNKGGLLKNIWLPFCSTRDFRSHWAHLRSPALSFDSCAAPVKLPTRQCLRLRSTGKKVHNFLIRETKENGCIFHWMYNSLLSI